MQRINNFPLALTCIFLASCGKKAAEPIAYPPRPVIVQTIAAPSGTETRTFSGVTKAAGGTTLGFEVAGRIISVPAQEGQLYQKGDILAQLDVSNYEADLRKAEAEALNANEELKRTQQLFESSNSSRTQFDSAIAAQRSAAASLTVARKKVADGTLLMPYDGVIQEVIADEQNVVAAGNEVVRIQGGGNMEATIAVPAEVIAAVSVGMPATVEVGKLTPKPLPATVKKTSPQASQNATYKVTLSLSDVPAGVRGGMDAEAGIVFPNPLGETVRAESAAVVSESGGAPFVWTISPTSGGQGTVSKRMVKIGKLSTEGTLEILDGLSPGEIVVTRGVHHLSEGAVVTITESTN